MQLFRDRPSLATDLLTGSLAVPLPRWQDVRLDSAEVTDLTPAQHHADAVVTLLAGHKPVLAVIVEVQLRPDPAKRWTWPLYVAALRVRLRCPCLLLVICPGKTVADWAASRIELGHPGMTLTPLVAGPAGVPIVADAEHARDAPELAVLSAMTHGGDPDADTVLEALLTALTAVDEHHAGVYLDVVLAALPAAARTRLEALMTAGTYEYQSDFARRYVHQGRAEGEAKGEAKGEARAVLAVLAARGVDVPDDARDRITDCTDLDQLDLWIRRAVTVDSIKELFER